MTTWLQRIRKELAEMSENDYIEPQSPITQGDNPICTACDEAKRLYTLAATRLELITGIIKQQNAKLFVSEDTIKLLGILKMQNDTIMAIFWATIRETHGLWKEHNIGIRKGWVVVATSPVPTFIVCPLSGGGLSQAEQN